MATLLVTGADGFVGRHVCALARARGHAVHAAVRHAPHGAAPPHALEGTAPDALTGVRWIGCGAIGPDTDWGPALAGVDAVVHLAGRAHQLAESGPDLDGIYHRVNVEGTLQLARAALKAGVRRMVFISTILVHGRSSVGHPIREDSPADPQDAYARSKWEAELALANLATEGLEPVVVRPCLVYGPGVKGNLARLLRAIAQGLPLPLAGIRNARSLVDVADLGDLLLCCATDPRAAGQAFVAADPNPLATPELVRALAAGLERPARLFPLPGPLLRAGLGLVGRGRLWEQLSGSQVVEASKSRALLQRSPGPDTVAGLTAMGRWYRQSRIRP